MSNPRNTAALILLKIEKDGAYSNLTVSDALKTGEYTPEDRAFISALVYGVLDRKLTLDFVLARFMRTPLKKTAPLTLQVLRCALYQIMYMDKIPQSAAVNEAVKIIKKSRESRNAGFVNAVLRAILRTETLLPEDNSVEALSLRYSCPEWIIESFVSDYGKENAIALLEESLKPPKITIRVNTVKTDIEYVKTELQKQAIEFEDGINQDSLILSKGIDISKNELYKKGLFYVQDAASQSAVEVLSPKAGDRVLDMCAAPGGKSFTMAQIMKNEGEIVSCDLHAHRIKLISESAKRLGLDIIKPIVCDATVFNEELGKFDCVLCDVPCSGLGVIRRKPDIKYNTQNNFQELEKIQYKIFMNAVKYLKPGGKILYSTCTLRSAENEKLVISVQKEYNTLYKMYEHSFMPHIDKTDGFYCALFESRK